MAATFAPPLTVRVVALRPDGTILSAMDGLHEQPSVDNADHTVEVAADASLLPTLLDLYVDAGWTAVSRVLVALEVAAAASSTWVLMATQRFVYGTAAILLALDPQGPPGGRERRARAHGERPQPRDAGDCHRLESARPDSHPWHGRRVGGGGCRETLAARADTWYARSLHLRH